MFRHSYDFELDPVRLNALGAAWRERGAAVLAALRAFAAWLRGDECSGPVGETK
ncbi:MAG: hypothetical protein HS113_18660 [Verrucomicrobiales bacterium]|nr:hypothetical protein [Verrucomicrobiales bacterium]